MTTAKPQTGASSSHEDEPKLLDLFLFTAADHTFAVPAEEIDGTAEVTSQMPLPHAPPSVLGVVYARGRMLTVLDPLALTDKSGRLSRSGFTIISLRGDEQLGVAAESVRETITVLSADIEPPPAGPDAEIVSAVSGVLLHGGEKVIILDPPQLFDAAVRRKDRRRRRL